MQKIDCKNEIYAKNWVRSTWIAKVNSGKKSTVKVNGHSKTTVNADVNKWHGRWRHLGLTSAEDPWCVQACVGAWRIVSARDGAWRRVPVTPRILVARGGAWKVRWIRYFTERQIEEISFWWCNLWSDRRSGSSGGGKAVVFDVLKSRWRQWCCSQQQLQMTPKKTRLLKSGTPKD